MNHPVSRAAKRRLPNKEQARYSGSAKQKALFIESALLNRWNPKDTITMLTQRGNAPNLGSKLICESQIETSEIASCFTFGLHNLCALYTQVRFQQQSCWIASQLIKNHCCFKSFITKQSHLELCFVSICLPISSFFLRT